MTQMNSIQARQPWILLHEREAPRPRLDRESKAERVAVARRIEAQVTRARDRVFADFTMCSRPYY